MTEYVDNESGSPAPGGPRRRPIATFVVLGIAILVLVAACVSGALYLDHRSDVAAAEAAQRKEAAAAREKQARQEAAEAEATRVAAAEYKACTREWAPALRDLKTIDSRLDVGLNEDKYSDLVGAASVSYDRVEASHVTEECIDMVDGPVNKALNLYIKMTTKWNDCLYEDDYCTTDEIEPDMQAAWTRASNQLDRADNVIAALDPSGTDTTL